MSEQAGTAYAWVAHLRTGGTTPWRDWAGGGPGSGHVAAAEPPAPTRGALPGAQQLELLRRINLAAPRPIEASLAARVLAASGAGRGKSDLPLVGAVTSTYGPRPVDPAEVSAHELLRVAAVLLADDLVALGADEIRATPARPWRRRVRIVGDPLLAAAAREHLLTRGRPEGGPRPFVVAIGGPLDDLLAHTWTQRCFEHGSSGWEDWLRFWRERDQLPPRADLIDSVQRWGGRRPYVRVVTDPDLLPRHLGVRRLPQTRVPGADQAELARRIAAVVGLRVPAAERPALMRTLRDRMPAGAAGPVEVPLAQRDWVADAAARLARRVTRSGYPVAGDIADLAPRAASGTPTTVDHAQVLDLAVAMIADPAWRVAQAQIPQQPDVERVGREEAAR